MLGRRLAGFLCAALLIGCAGAGEGLFSAPALAPDAPVAFPGAVGWAAATPGGRGGRIVRVTTLANDGAGSLRAAIAEEGPKIIVFEVGGVIDLERRTLVVRAPFVTIAGQTAPSPGITLIRGGMDIAAHDVVVRHLRIRPGAAGQALRSGWDEDAISTQRAYNVIVDHCTLTWATDENLSASGPRFTGETPEEWRAGASHDITFSHNIIAEGLAHSAHSKGEHSKGSLIHDNTTNILIYANLYAHNVERSPLFKGGVHGAIINNFIYNPGPRAVHYNLQAQEWGDTPFETGRMVAVGNALMAGPSTPEGLAFLMIGGEGDLEYFGRDNIAVGWAGEPLAMFARYTTSRARIIETPRARFWPPGVTARPAHDVQQWVLAHAGARPWDRDAHDIRVIADAAEGRGAIIDDESEVGGYPSMAETRRAFNEADWDLATMTPLRDNVLDSGARARGT